jgi:hypothetical protein
LGIKDEKQLERIKNKMDIILRNEEFLNNALKRNKSKHVMGENESKVARKKYYTFGFLKEAGFQFSCVAGLSLSTYIYIEYFTDFFTKTKSLKLFKPLFVVTFVLTPSILSFYFSYLDYTYKV